MLYTTLLEVLEVTEVEVEVLREALVELEELEIYTTEVLEEALLRVVEEVVADPVLSDLLVLLVRQTLKVEMEVLDFLAKDMPS